MLPVRGPGRSRGATRVCCPLLSALGHEPAPQGPRRPHMLVAGDDGREEVVTACRAGSSTPEIRPIPHGRRDLPVIPNR